MGTIDWDTSPGILLIWVDMHIPARNSQRSHPVKRVILLRVICNRTDCDDIIGNLRFLNSWLDQREIRATWTLTDPIQ
jgi:hypothetical protein